MKPGRRDQAVPSGSSRQAVNQDREAAKRVVLEIIRIARGTIRGRVRLYKAFYAAHLYYWEENQGTLTNYPIVHMPFGPGIDAGEELLMDLQDEGFLQIATRMKGPYREEVFTRMPHKMEKLDSARVEAIRRAVDWIKRKTATQLSNETHEFSRSWNSTRQGEEMNVYLDALTERELRDIQRRVKETEGLVSAVFDRPSPS